MNEWDELVNGLETEVPPLDDLANARILDRAARAVRRRRRRRWLPLALAGVLVLSACGYAAATGQFSKWFWNMASDPRQPEASEDLLAGLGTAIGQSQTVDGVTVTLNGALWDGYDLVLSLSLDGDAVPTDYWTQVESSESWLHSSRAQMERHLREYDPDLSEEAIQAYLDSCGGSREYYPEINYLYNRQTGSYQMQISQGCSWKSPQELTLHLENLNFKHGPAIAGPFEFTFTVEPKDLSLTYTGDVAVEPDGGVPLRITAVTVSPFRVEAVYETAGPVSEDADLSAQFREHPLAIRTDGGEGGSGAYRTSIENQEDGRASGYAAKGPFRRAVDPASVEAVEVCGVWVELSEMDPG